MMYKKTLLSLLIAITLVGVAACDQGAHSTRGFRLPEGNVDNGKALFASYGCVACHTVDGVDSQEMAPAIESPVVLGGPVTLAKTYADLVTSIINPSHRISRELDQDIVQRDGQSLMRNYNEEMTVAHLIDIVAFLQPQYELVDVPRTRP